MPHGALTHVFKFSEHLQRCWVCDSPWKYFSHPSLVMYSFATPPIKLKLDEENPTYGGFTVQDHILSTAGDALSWLCYNQCWHHFNYIPNTWTLSRAYLWNLVWFCIEQSSWSTFVMLKDLKHICMFCCSMSSLNSWLQESKNQYPTTSFILAISKHGILNYCILILFLKNH